MARILSTSGSLGTANFSRKKPRATPISRPRTAEISAVSRMIFIAISLDESCKTHECHCDEACREVQDRRVHHEGGERGVLEPLTHTCQKEHCKQIAQRHGDRKDNGCLLYTSPSPR